MSITWKNPPSIVVMGGSEQFLVQREVRHAKLQCFRNGLRTELVHTDNEVVDILTASATFGGKCLICIDVENLTPETVKDVVDNPVNGVCVLVVCSGELPVKKCKWLKDLPKRHIKEHNIPSRKSDKVKVAKRFLSYECDRLLGKKDTIPNNLVKAVVDVVGVDLGLLSFEALKYSSYVTHNHLRTITPDVVMGLIKQSDDLDLDSVRTSLKNKNKKELCKSLYKITVKSSTDPTMLMLRGRGGPLDILYSLLLVKQSVAKKRSADEIASRLGIPLWSLQKDLINVSRKWDTKTLKNILFELADLETSLLKGCPNSWVAFQTILLKYL